MLDILPPTAGSEGLSRRGNTRPARPMQQLTSPKPRPLARPVPPKPVELAWKLPARLRKPIREQLARQRRQKKQRASIVRFERRPLRTQLVTAPPALGSQNQGAEYHTGDIYTASRPASRVALPPYAGSFARRLVSVSSPKLQRARLGSTPTQAPARPRPVRKIPVASEQYLDAPPVSGAAANVSVPKRRLALPLSFSLWPTALLTSKKKVHTASVALKKIPSRVKNLGVLGVGCLLLMAALWSLQGLGRGVAVKGSVEQQARAAYEKLLAAQAAFAATDFSAGEAQLQDAGQLLAAARSDLRQALSATQYVLQAVDVTGTLTSGDQLLAAGEHLTDAGQFIARGAAGFFDVSLFGPAGERQPKPASLIDALMYAQQEFEPAVSDLKAAEQSLDKVNSPWLPAAMRSQVALLKKTVPRVREFLDNWQRHSDMMLDLLGQDRQRQYLLLFANNDELRPVGGFLGTIGLVNVDKGRVENIDISSVYEGDGQLKEFIAPPDPLLPIVDRWYLRDANWFVDYPTSARKIAAFFEKEGGPSVDGVILLTPEVVKRLLAVSGPIEVPAYHQTLTAENFAKITQAEVTYSYDRALNKPKQFLADAAPLLLNRLFGASPHYGDVLQALAVSLQQKDLLLYFRDQAAQARLAEAGWAGSLPPSQPGFLMVNNANIGGHKSDQFINQEIDYRVEVDGRGAATAVVTIRRSHLGPQEGPELASLGGENPATKDNIVYQRVLVPYGSRLLEAKGYTPPEAIVKQLAPQAGVPVVPDADVAAWQTSQVRDNSGTTIGQEAGYTFFANWIVTKPGQTTVTLYRYALPEKFAMPGLISSAQPASLLMVKQPGAQRTSLRASLKLPAGTRIVHTVPQSGVTQESDNEIVYRGQLSTDVVVGAVFTGR